MLHHGSRAKDTGGSGNLQTAVGRVEDEGFVGALYGEGHAYSESRFHTF